MTQPVDIDDHAHYEPMGVYELAAEGRGLLEDTFVDDGDGTTETCGCAERR